jgi:hypothetical protein
LFCHYMNFTVLTAVGKLKNCAVVMSAALSVLPAEKMPEKYCQPFNPAKVQPEAELPPQVAEGERKPAAAVAEPV